MTDPTAPNLDSIPPDSARQLIGLQRPLEEFQRLPLEVRWEATRRHPVYQLVWRSAKAYVTGSLPPGSPERDRTHLEVLLLGGIGVSGEPIDPATPTREVLNGVGPLWLGGAVRPMTLRALATMLYWALPPAERWAVGAVFAKSTRDEYSVEGDDADRSRQTMLGSLELQGLVAPVLDQFVANVPLYRVEMSAPQRVILEEMTRLVRDHHANTDQPDRRTRTDTFDDALHVWDLREGWIDGTYESNGELRFEEIAQRLRCRRTTAEARYRAAFRLVTGLDFTPENWWRLMGPLKLLTDRNAARGVHASAVLRQLQGRTRRPVPESTLQSGEVAEDRPGLVTGTAAVETEQDWVELRIDLDDLLDRGLDDNEVAQRLEIDPAVVAVYRERRREFGTF